MMQLFKPRSTPARQQPERCIRKLTTADGGEKTTVRVTAHSTVTTTSPFPATRRNSCLIAHRHPLGRSYRISSEIKPRLHHSTVTGTDCQWKTMSLPMAPAWPE